MKTLTLYAASFSGAAPSVAEAGFARLCVILNVTNHH